MAKTAKAPRQRRDEPDASVRNGIGLEELFAAFAVPGLLVAHAGKGLTPKSVCRRAFAIASRMAAETRQRRAPRRRTRAE